MTDVPLREYIESRINSLEDKIISQSKYIEQHFELNERAIKKAEEAMLVRLETMNEFRAQINKERTDYVTKEALAVCEKNTDARLKKLEMAGSFSAGRMWVVMAAFAAIPTILAIISLFVR
jgi:uncharacterized coiled-coil protein SlyX